MNFLHPLYLAGLAAVALPIVIHFLTRPRPRTFPLSTLRFVREAVSQRRARRRFRDWLVLLLRAAAVALIALAFARPLIGAKKLPAGPEQDVARVVILDQSLSMSAVSNGVAAFERGRAAAGARLGYRSGLSADLILAAARARPLFAAPSSNFGAMREALASAGPLPEALNLKAAIDAAGEMLARTAPGVRRELVVVSDFQRSDWSSADFSPLPKDVAITLESVAPKQPPANLAVVRAAVRGRAEQGGPTHLEIEVGNYSPTPRKVDVEVSIGGGSYRLSGECAARRTAVLATDVVLNTPGWQGGEARLVGAQDALPADDVRYFAVDVRPPTSYLLVTRESSQPRATSSHFLELALAPIKPRQGGRGVRVVRADPDALDRDAAGSADVIVLDRPGRLSGESIKLLASVVRRGRAMLYVASEPADAGNLALLAEAAGADLKLPVRFVPPTSPAARQGLFVGSHRPGGVFAVFGQDVAAALAPLRFGGGLDSQTVAGGLADDVLATFSDNSAALVLTPCGAGRLAVLNTDLDQSNLPASAAFVPLLGELIERLVEPVGGSNAVACGERTAVSLPPEVTSGEGLRVSAPPGAAGSAGTLVEQSGLVSWQLDPAGPPGFYQVRRGADTLFALATATPPGESDLTTIDPGLLTGRLSGGRSIHFQSSGDDSTPPEVAWSWIVTACVGCMLLEVAVLKVFGT